MAMSGGGDDGAMSTSDATLAPSAWALAPTQPPTTADLWALYAFGANDMWIAGSSGAIQHYTGTWTTTPSSAVNTLFMFFGTPTDLWLVGRSCVSLHWAGSSWASGGVPGCTGNQDFFSMKGTSSTNMWASGVNGNMQQFTGTWTDRSYGNDDIWDVHVASATDVTAVGTAGTILHWNGTGWTPETSTVSVTLAAFASPSPGEFWVVGLAGTILHKIGGTWTQAASPTAMNLYDVIAVSPTDLWAVGSGGVILHGDGTKWVLVQSPTTNTLRNLERIPGGGIAAVGTAGTLIMHP